MTDAKHLQHAMQWFKEHDVDCFVDDTNLYVNVGFITVQVSPVEVRYRSDLQPFLK